MKNFFTLFCLLMSVSFLQAQLPDGSVAPNFNAKDINGRTWNLYDVLATGRPVLIDISATWCGPCWSYHESGALESFYALYGPQGEGKAMVFFVEGDGATNTDCLYGPTGCNNSTQGNWVEDTPYPIFDNNIIANAYNTNYFPTVYLICPDKILTEVGQVDFETIWAAAEPCVGQIPANYARITALQPGTRTREICTPQAASPLVSFTNMGGDIIQTAEIALRWNGDIVQTKTFTGNAGVFDLAELVFDPFSVPGPGSLSAEIMSVNGQPNWQSSNLAVEFTEAPKAFGTQQIVLYLRTDVAAKDIYWGLYDDAGTLLDHGGNELVGPNGGGAFPEGAPNGPGAYADNLITRDTLTLPADGCFSFKMVDAQGNGMIPPGHFKLFELGNTAAFYTKVGNFGSVDYHTFAPKTSGLNDPQAFSSLEIYPNPAYDVLTVEFSINTPDKVSSFVTDATGRILWKSDSAFPTGMQQMSVPLQQFNNGMYWLTLQTTQGLETRRFAVAR